MQTATELWNGTCWAETADLNTGRYLLAGSGSTTAGLAFGGDTDPGRKALTESWNGSAWTEVNDLNTAREQMAGFGTSTSSLASGGSAPPRTAVTELWNGVAWSETSDLSTARNNLARASAGTTTNGLVFAGDTGSLSAATEEWSSSSQVIDTITTS